MSESERNKVDIVDALRHRFSFTSYLELTTTTTGLRYAAARELGFERCLRLVYRYPGSIHDGLPVDFSSPDEDISAPLDQIHARGLSFDVILVDAHHTYHCASRDLWAAYQLVRRGGALVVHDCDPPDIREANPTFIDGSWAGTTYKAYLDFTISNYDLDYFTMDFDWGCGVIFKSARPVQRLRNYGRILRRAGLAARWREATRSGNYDDAFDFFRSRRRALLRLGGWDLLERKMSAGI